MPSTRSPSTRQPQSGHQQTARTARLEARMSREQKALLERAAARAGRSVTDFVVISVQAAAQATIRQHEVIILTARDSQAFVEALLHPPGPNAALRAAARRLAHA